MHKFRFLLPVAVALCAIVLPVTASAQLYVSVNAPPPLPVYEQPQLSSPNSIWTPGYWAMGGQGYYWVPGSWQQAPQVGFMWTPGYWGYGQNQYSFNQGYWGPQVGYYGGVNYGYGYSGNGYYGGGWQGNAFRYNTAVSNVNRTVIRNVYVDRTVIVRNASRTSYNGGTGGLRAVPTAQQQAAARQQHVAPTRAQQQRASEAAYDRSNLESVNHGDPGQPAAAAPKPAVPVARMAPAAKPAAPAAQPAHQQAARAPQQMSAPKPMQARPAPAQARPAEKPAGPPPNDKAQKPPA